MLEKVKEIIAKNRAKAEIEKNWAEVMVNTGTLNENKDTFSLIDLQETAYGFKGGVYIVAGLSYSELEKKVEYIEDYLGCTIVLNKKKRTNIASIKFVFRVKTISYTPVKVKPWEVYIGNDIDGEAIIISMIEAPHILLSGSTRGGKSKLLDCINTTLINCCNEFELELYLIQVAKSDFVIFEDAKQVRGFAETLEQAETILKHIVNKMNERNKLIKPMRKSAKGSNYMDYNKINADSKLSTVYVELDEMASLIDNKGDSGEVKKQKERIVSNLEKIAQYGASLGIFLISCLQRPTADKLPPFVKSQSTLKISFRQNNTKSSEVAVDDPQAALKLEQREAVYSIAGEFKYLKVPTIYDKTVYKFIQSSLKPNHRTIFSDLQKIKTNINIANENPSDKDNHKGREKITEEEQCNSKENNVIPLFKDLPKVEEIKELQDVKEEIESPLQQEESNDTISVIVEDKPKDNAEINESKPVENTSIPISEEELKRNIENIPGYVPYEPPRLNATIIDQTKIPAKTEKPRRGKEKL